MARGKTFILIGRVVAVTVVAASASQATGAAFSYTDYAALLADHVDDSGMVDYEALKSDPGELEQFVSALATLDPEFYESWPEAAQIAFWINAYNALTLKAVIDHYPIQASLVRSFVYPKSSIRQIPGVWTELKWSVMGRPMTLDHIEHHILRKQFNEPRIHAALVCAALGCPPLRNVPFEGQVLDRQLDGQMKRFLSDPRKFRVERKAGVVWLSPIFKWFGDDFLRKHGTGSQFTRQSATIGAVVHAIIPHVHSEHAEYLRSETYSVKFLDYDWTLNEQQQP